MSDVRCARTETCFCGLRISVSLRLRNGLGDAVRVTHLSPERDSIQHTALSPHTSVDSIPHPHRHATQGHFPTHSNSKTGHGPLSQSHEIHKPLSVP